jgi:putative ABC transport system substrate-binding protein
LVPQATTIAILVNPNFQEAERQLSSVQAAADALKIQLIVLKASTEGEVDSAFATLGQQRVGALQIGTDPFFNSRPEQFVALAARFAVPTMYSRREFAAAGGLASYGTQLPAYLEGRVYGRRLPMTVELVISLKTAKALGLTIPLTLLRSANEVIE